MKERNIRYYKISCENDPWEEERAFEAVMVKKYKCPDCHNFIYTNTETIPLHYYRRTGALGGFFLGYNIGTIALPLKEILDRFGFSGLFYIGNLSYKGKPLDDFKTYAPRQPRVPSWGGGSCALVEGCPTCGRPDFSIPDSRIHFVEEGYFREDIDIYPGPCDTNLFISAKVFALIPDKMRRKMRVRPIRIIDHAEVEHWRGNGLVTGPSGKAAPLKTLKEGEYKPLRPLPTPPYLGLPECVRAEGVA